MTSFIELWLKFLLYGLRSLFSLRSPLTVLGEERLHRALFSGHVKNDGITLNPNAFLINHKSEHGISVNRASLAPLRLFRKLAEISATARRVNFKGFAEFQATALNSIKLQDSWRLGARGAPTSENPFHADIALPEKKEKDYYLLIAIELISKSNIVH